MPPSRKTLHILRADARGGLEVSTLHVVRYLAAQPLGTHGALFLSPLGDGISRAFVELGVPVAAVPYRRRARIGFLRALVGRIRAVAPDLVLVHGAFGLHALIAAAARVAGVGRVWTFVVNRPPPAGLPRLAQHGAAHAGRLFASGEIAVSAFVRRVLIDEYRLPAARVHTAYRWRDLDGIERAAHAERTRSATPDLAAGRTAPVLGTIGRLDWMKDHATLIGALAALALPGARLEIVGEGEDRGRLAALAAELGVADRVALEGHRTDIGTALGGWDLFVFATTHFEGLPNVLVEAMAAGVPIVCTDVGPCREVLADGRAGVLVPPRDPAALAAAVHALWADAPRRARLAATAREWAHTHFTAAANGPALVRLLYPEAAPSRARGATRRAGRAA
jgi:glycosyltransferase involved in cell wall biosynthesis